MKKIIESEKAPKPIGPYSQAVLVDDTLYISGCLGMDFETGLLKESIEMQTELAIINLKEILLKANMDLSNVVKTTVFITNMDDFSKVNSVYADYFVNDCPARSCVEISKLPKNALVEIEAIAKKS